MMSRIRKILERYGFYCFLLPAFFILHSYLQYFGLVSGSYSFLIFLILELILVLISLVIFLFTKNANRSLAITAAIAFIYLFYGVAKDFIDLDLGIKSLTKYTLMVPVTLLVTIFLIIVLARKKYFARFNLYLNSLLIIFILVDASNLFFQKNEALQKKNVLAGKKLVDPGSLPKTLSKPDIYLLVFDCYPGTGFLKDYMQFDNSQFSKQLENRGFHIIPESRSNYNRTAFSMASALNFEYLEGIKTNVSISPEKYTRAISSIRYATVPEIMKDYGYDIYNLSVFDIGNNHPIHRETFLTLPQRQVLLYNTLGVRIERDILWNFLGDNHSIGFLKYLYGVPKKEEMESQLEKKIFNNIIIDSTQKISLIKSGVPKFIYSHFYLPHPPFFYDADGRENNPDSVITEESLKNKTL